MTSAVRGFRRLGQSAARDWGCGCSWAAADRAAWHKARLGLQLQELQGAPPH